LLFAGGVGFSTRAAPSSAAPVQVDDDEDVDVIVRADEPDLVAVGRDLYEVGCSSCHGLDGEGLSAPDGSVRGPSLLEAGEASAYYYLTTGRMPLANSEEIPERKDRAYDDEEIDAIVAFVGSLGDDEAPALPAVDIAEADLAVGGDLYREHCQACHQASGAGGALSYGRAAPSLEPSTPLEVGAAMRSGPGQMPVFGPDLLTQDEVDDIARYVRYLSDPADPGGLPIGRTGPVPEGFVSWIVGVGALLALSAWIGTRSPIARRRAHP
jgi:ubiquinol-cytochrome c reductase cytochrome c subunit